MAVTLSAEFASTVEEGRMFKALILDAPNLFPKLMPAIKSIQLVEGNGGPGSIQKITIVEGDSIKYVKHRIDAIDKENLIYNYAVIEGDAKPEMLELVSHEVKIEPSKEGGCKIKNVSKYYPKKGFEIKEEDLKDAREEALVILKVVDAYLVANPKAYA
ncbi:major allergen Pru ar 1-like protein [Trifolium pratense]|uniref:Major allergen Pru ar 1-like protein n=1 Tax=Trifolium pratense TaxID=57577 RepID=A0A2K3NIC8_TRIPR|nr:major allergen Pru ar 1-like protein [Trifolium pratense]